MIYTERTTCRLCNGALESIINLGPIYLSTFTDTNDIEVPKVPIELMKCMDCHLAQLKHTVNPDYMYSDYWYQSGLNDSMIKALKDVVTKVTDRTTLKEGDVILDIGANDGTLLTNYPDNVIKIACEPNNLAHLAESKCDILINDYFTAESYYEGTKDLPDRISAKAKIITAIAMFYDLEDPHIFVEDLRDVLREDGIICIQMMDLLSMVQCNDFPNLCHEHLEYYTLQNLCDLMSQHKLKVFDVEYNGVNGGSLRAYICHKEDRKTLPIVKQSLKREKEFFSNVDLSVHFRQNIETVRDKIITFIENVKQLGEQKIAVLGASTKGNTTLQYFSLDESYIDHAAEINPDKFGKKTVGSNIPIICQDESLNQNPHYYLVLPWGFIDHFIKKFDTYLRQGGTFIVPLPQPRLIYMYNNEIQEWLL